MLLAGVLLSDRLRPPPEPGLLPVQRFVVLVDGTGQARNLLEARADGQLLARPAGIAQASFAVSLEPEGGSLTGAPTGPVVLTQRP